MIAEQFIKHLQLQPHPEGGFFKEMYRSSGTIPLEFLTADFKVNAPIQQPFISYCSKEIILLFIALPPMNAGIFMKVGICLFILLINKATIPVFV